MSIQDRPKDIPATEEISEDDLGIRGVSDVPVSPSTQQPTDSFRDTFFGPTTKGYLDFNSRRITKLRGTYCYYHVLRSQTEKMDDTIPVSKNRDAGPFDNVRRAGGETSSLLKDAKGIAAMYGETITVGPRLSSVEREVIPTWNFAEPIEIRGVLTDPERAEIPDARGSIFTHRIRLWLARVLCDEEYLIRPRIGDVVRLPDLITNPTLTSWSYYDVQEVALNNTRFGATGFFTAYTLQLERSSRFVPDRKLPANDLKEQRDPTV